MATDDDAARTAQRLKGLYERALDHPGKRAAECWQEWGIVAQAMQRNERDLLALIDAPSKSDDLAVELIQNVREPAVQRAFYRELYRLLHNYLASIKTLVDHSRVLMRGYAASDFDRDYRTKTQRLSQDPVVAFVQDLRNVLLHHRLPPIVSTLRVAGGQLRPRTWCIGFPADQRGVVM